MRKLPITWAYLAGFMDGEGCISIVSKNGKLKRIEVGLFQSEKQDEVLHVIANFLDENEIVYYWTTHTSGRSANAHPTTHLRMTRQASVTRFLEGVMPYLIVKAVKAEYVLFLLHEKNRLGIPLSHLKVTAA